METMPSKKIFVVLILCIGVIISVWIFQGDGTVGLFQKNNLVSIESSPENTLPNTSTGNQDWLSSPSIASTTVTKTTPYPDEGTVTDQVSKDFFAQYLDLIKQNNGQITDAEASQIAKNALSSPDYLKTNGATYTAKNLHVSKTATKDEVQRYSDAIKQSFKNRAPKNKDTEMQILERAMQSGKESDLALLDTIIVADKGVISDFVNMTIPSDAVQVHLDFVNSASDVLSNTEAMRQTFSDPIKSFAGLSQYNPHVTQMMIALKNLEVYFQSKK